MKIEVGKIGGIVSSGNAIVLNNDNIVGARYEKLRLDAISIAACSLSRCVFDDVHAESVNLGGGVNQSVYDECQFVDCDFVFGAVGNVRLVNCHFKRCNLSNLVGITLELIGCVFEETKISRGVFHASSPNLSLYLPRRKTNEFQNNDFSTTDLIGVDFRGGIDLGSQRLPSGAGYIFIGDTCKAAADALKLEKLELGKKEAAHLKSTISLLTFYCSTGQKQQLLATTPLAGLADRLREILNPLGLN